MNDTRKARAAEGRPRRHSLSSAVRSCLTNYARFKGRASRSEFWLWNLAVILSGFIVLVVTAGFISEVDEDAGFAVWVLFQVAVLVPSTAVLVRRLHDTDRSGHWLWIALVPLASIALLVFAILPGTPGPNRFGVPSEPVDRQPKRPTVPPAVPSPGGTVDAPRALWDEV